MTLLLSGIEKLFLALIFGSKWGERADLSPWAVQEPG